MVDEEEDKEEQGQGWEQDVSVFCDRAFGKWLINFRVVTERPRGKASKK
jgi:hypothetical protein